MLKKLLIGTVLCFGIFCFVQSGKAQDLSKEELKLMQQAMKDSLNSEKYKERQAKLEALLAKPPAACGLESIDGLATSSQQMIQMQDSTNKLLQSYVGQLTEEGEGTTTQQAGKKVTVDDVLQLSTNIANQILAATNALTGLTAVLGDATKVSPMKIGIAKKSLAYTKDALVGLGLQLKAELNLVKQMQTYTQAIKNL